MKLLKKKNKHSDMNLQTSSFYMPDCAHHFICTLRFVLVYDSDSGIISTDKLTMISLLVTLQTVTIVFSSFDTAYYRDFVYVYDGYNTSARLLATVTGYYPSNLTYTTSQRFMFIRFTSGTSSGYSGFYATYMISVQPGFYHIIVLHLRNVSCGLYMSMKLNN
jgi:CUB domain